jgi:hypothetical protein
MEHISNERYQEKVALRQASYAHKKASATQEKGLICASSSIPTRLALRLNGAWNFEMTLAMLLVGDSNRDCEGTRAYY